MTGMIENEISKQVGWLSLNGCCGKTITNRCSVRPATPVMAVWPLQSFQTKGCFRNILRHPLSWAIPIWGKAHSWTMWNMRAIVWQKPTWPTDRLKNHKLLLPCINWILLYLINLRFYLAVPVPSPKTTNLLRYSMVGRTGQNERHPSGWDIFEWHCL